MPIEDPEEHGMRKMPNFKLAQALFILQRAEAPQKDREEAKQLLDKEINLNNMAPFYKHVCSELKWPTDEKKLAEMGAANKKELESLDEKIKDSEENFGEVEQRDANMNKAEYLANIGDKTAAVEACRQAYEKTTMLGHKLDNVFLQLRLGFFWQDSNMITRNLEKANSLIEGGGDWDRRNRLKVYQAYYCLMVRDFKKATDLFLDSIATFTCYELMDYTQFVHYTVVAAIISLKRNELGKKIVEGSEIIENLFQLPLTKRYLDSLYEFHYADFFKCLADIEQSFLCDRLLAPHASYYVREMKIIAYAQQLDSYRSLTLQYMANSFGVSQEYVDKELSRFIAAGRLNCKIDKVNGIVETNRPDSKNFQYQSIIKQGDILLNRIQKLSRVINL